MKKIYRNLFIPFLLLITTVFYACNKEDNISPIMTLNGDTLVGINLNTPYIDAGATAADDKDGDLTKSIYVKNEVNINKVGRYKVYYSVSDKAGNVAATLARTVVVGNSSNKYIGIWDVKNYTLYPISDSTFYTSTLIIDSTINNRLIFIAFGDSIPKNVYFNVNGNEVEFPFQKIQNPADSVWYSFQGNGSINDTIININYFKGSGENTHSCKANFHKQ